MSVSTRLPRQFARLRAVGLVAAATALVLVAPRAWAQDRVCAGPPECCVAQRATAMDTPQEVTLGVVVMGLHNINERAGTWDADYYLYESWAPAAGFTPQTEVTNEVSRASEQFDTTWLIDGRCLRTRRIRSTVYSAYDLRRFPFDRQRLTVRISDSAYDSSSVRYARTNYALGIDDDARGQLGSFRLDGPIGYEHTRRAWRWEAGQPRYDYATFSLPVRRHVTFHFTRFFLPLLVIMIVAFTVFWIDPDDLNSQIGIGVTCLLASIAFQYTQASSLPEVAYLTLADRVYACCYPAIALAMIESVVTNHYHRKERGELARRIDRTSRWAFPLALGIAIAVSAWIATRTG